MSVNSKNRTVSFIVPAFNEELYIGSCLASIVDEMESDDELIVVDNGSTDRTHEIVRGSPRATLIVAPEISIAAMRNLGVMHSRGDILAFIDGDCTIEAGWRKAVLAILEQNKVAATGCAVLVPDSAGWIPRAWRVKPVQENHDVPYLNSANFAVKRDAFERIDGFREDLISDEDTDIGNRLTGESYRIVESCDIVALHHDNPESLMEFFHKERWHATSILRSISKHRTDKAFIMTVVFMMTLFFGLAAIVLGVVFAPLYLAGVLFSCLAPLATAFFRMSQGKSVRYFLPLCVLYAIFYTARTLVLVRAVLDFKGKP